MNEQLIVTLKVDELKNIIDECLTSVLSKLPQKPEEDDLLKRDEVAKLFKVSLVTLNQWMRDDRIAYHKINSRIFFKRSEVLEALKSSIKKYGRKNENL